MPKELLGDTRTPANRVVGQLLFVDQVDSPCLGVPTGDLPQRFVHPEEIDQIAARVAEHDCRACLHVRSHRDIPVEEYPQRRRLAFRNQPDRGQLVEHDLIAVAHPSGNFLIRQLAQCHGSRQGLDLDAKALGHALRHLSQAEATALAVRSHELDCPPAVLLSTDARHYCFPFDSDFAIVSFLDVISRS
ncbi:MAG: hypothetical protein HY290_22425 [Planctomycetia bacterium]|nr:hypothetical protein [Planctomycetia bacterium]